MRSGVLAEMQSRLRKLNFRKVALQSAIICSIYFAFIILVAIGPTLQYYLSNLIISNKDSIYDTACGNCIYQFPKFLDWIDGVIGYASIIVSSVVVLISVFRRDMRSIFIVATVSCFLALTLTDVVSNGFSASAIAIGLVSNALGAPVLAGLMVLLVHFSNQIIKYFAGAYRIASVLAAVVPCLTAVMLNVAIYFLLALFYRTSSVSVDALTQGKVYGYYRSTDSSSNRGSTQDARFILLNQSRADGNVEWTGMSKPLVLTWRNNDTSHAYDLAVSYYSGCFSDKGIPIPGKTSKESTTFHAIKSVSLRADNGLAELRVLPVAVGDYGFKLKDADGLKYRIDPDSKSSKVKLTGFATSPKFTVWNSDGYMDVYVGLFALGSENNKIYPATRRLKLQVDGAKRSFSFAPPSHPPASASLNCSPLKLASSGRGEVSASALIGGMVLRFMPQRAPLMFENRNVNELTVGGANGWFEYTFPLGTKDSVITEGVSELFTVSGKFERILIDSKSVDSNSRLQVFGRDVTETVYRDGSMWLYGASDGAFLDGKRLNRTRWEDLGWPGRLLLISWIAAVVLWATRVLFKVLRDNEELEWFVARADGRR